MGNQVLDWMSSDPVSVSENASALEAFDLVVEHGIRHLPVLDARERVIGILSIDDLRAAFPFEVSPRRPLDPSERQQALDHRVCDVMSWAPLTVHPGDPLEVAARRLASHRIGCLPVVNEEQKLIGILSETDALRALAVFLHGAAAGPDGEQGGDGFVAALLAERERIVEQLARWQEAERALSADIREEPRDSAERAADEGGVAALEPLSERAALRLRAIDHALERAEQGRFGICERCQGRIPATRLRAVPEATLCLRCARSSAGATSAQSAR
jgi:CBS domain-containing protein/RNA polymerase-binding transcription factor DksA